MAVSVISFWRAASVLLDFPPSPINWEKQFATFWRIYIDWNRDMYTGFAPPTSYFEARVDGVIKTITACLWISPTRLKLTTVASNPGSSVVEVRQVTSGSLCRSLVGVPSETWDWHTCTII